MAVLALGTTAGAAPAPLADDYHIFTNSGQALGDTQSSAVALGDVDSDGDLDAYIVNAAIDRVWRNNGDGTFSEDDQNLSFGFGLSVALGDLDRDGDLDAFLGISGPNEVWLNDGGNQGGIEGFFVDSDQRLGTANSNGVALADVDDDGDLDATVANGDASSPVNRLWLNQGGAQGGVEGYFQDSGEVLGAGWTNGVALGDLDGENGPDIYFARHGTDEVWLNDGSGDFTWQPGPELPNVSSGNAALGDFDRDGDLDVWVATAPQASTVLFNNGGAQGGTQGTFRDSGQLLGANSTVAIADVDGDFDLDAVAIRSAGGSNFDVWLNDGQGTFTVEQNDGSNYSDLALGNVDGQDGADLFLAVNGANEVWFNQIPVQEAADVSLNAPRTVYTFCENCDIYQGAKAQLNVTVHNAGPATANGIHIENTRGSTRFPDWPFGLAPGESFDEAMESPYQLGSGEVKGVAYFDATVTADEVDPDPLNNRIQTEAVLYRCQVEDILGCILHDFFCESYDPLATNTGSGFLASAQDVVIDLLVYYYVRDGVLGSTEQGQHYTDLYYTHNDEIKTLLEADSALKDESIATLQLWESNLWALVRGRGHTAVITEEQVQAVDNFLSNLSAIASPALQQVIAQERDALPPPQEFIGMTMEEARGIVVGYGIHLPALEK